MNWEKIKVIYRAFLILDLEFRKNADEIYWRRKGLDWNKFESYDENYPYINKEDIKS